MELDDLVCYCFHISKRKVLNYIRVHRPRRASQLSDCGSAGTGCGWCVPYLKRYFAEQQAALSGQSFAAAAASAVTDSSEVPLTPALIEGMAVSEPGSSAEYAQHRAAYIRAGKGRPAPGAVPLPESTEPTD